MALEKWHPLAELEHMRKEMERIWEEFSPSSRRLMPRLWHEDTGAIAPTLDVIDRGEEILVRVELPGVAKENIDISAVENALTVKGAIKEEKEYKDEDFIRKERNYRSFTRTVAIPVKIKPAGIKANLKDGILNVHLPKAEETRPKKIKVEVA